MTVMVDQRFFHPALVTTNVLAYNSARFLFRFDGLKIKDAPKYPASLHLHQCARGMYFLPRVTQNYEGYLISGKALSYRISANLL